MRRYGLLVGGWTLATILALVLGLQGVHSVSTTVTNPRPAALSPASVKAALQRVNAASSSSASAASAASTASSDGSASTATASNDSTDDRGSGDRPASPGFDPTSSSDGAASEHPASGPSSSSSESTDGFSSGGEGPDSSSSSSTVSQPPQDKTYQLVGGSVGVRFENGTARLLWANPNSGYRVETSSDGGAVEVRFDNGEHESRLHAWWDNGPQQQIEEGSIDD